MNTEDRQALRRIEARLGAIEARLASIEERLFKEGDAEEVRRDTFEAHGIMGQILEVLTFNQERLTAIVAAMNALERAIYGGVLPTEQGEGG